MRIEASAQLVLAHDLEHYVVQPDVLLPQRPTCAQHAVGQQGDQRIICHQLAHPRLEFAAANPAKSEPERLDRVPDRVLDIDLRLRRCVSRRRSR
jgi:hypothetical protein